jgi:anti-sigma factor RsiW
VRGKLSDQDLTDYALNELQPEERLYVESMLAISEECRNDIYATIDTAMMIEEGFDAEEGGGSLALTPEQRQALLNVRMPNYFLRRAVAVLAAAAAVAFALVNKEMWMPNGSVARVAQVSSQMSNYVAQAVSAAEGEDFVVQLASLRMLAEEPGKWLPSQPGGSSAVFGSSPSLNLEVAPHAALDLVP